MHCVHFLLQIDYIHAWCVSQFPSKKKKKVVEQIDRAQLFTRNEMKLLFLSLLYFCIWSRKIRLDFTECILRVTFLEQWHSLHVYILAEVGATLPRHAAIAAGLGPHSLLPLWWNQLLQHVQWCAHLHERSAKVWHCWGETTLAPPKLFKNWWKIGIFPIFLNIRNIKISNISDKATFNFCFWQIYIY